MVKKILHIWDADYPWDIRVEKISMSLLKSGYEVHIVCRNLKRRKKNEHYNGLHLHRLKAYKNSTLNNIISFPAFFNPIWIYNIFRECRTHGISLIIVRDLPLALSAIFVGRLLHIPVIFDMAENYPAMVRNIWKAKKFQGANLLVRNPYLASFVEKIAIKYCTHIFVVVEESKQRLFSEYKVSQKKVTIVSNTPYHSPLANYIKEDRQKNKIIYVGGIQMGRGIQFVLEALPIIAQQVPEIEFLIAGDGYAKKQLIDLSKKFGSENYVNWLGFIENTKISKYLAKCDIGVIPGRVTDHTNTTIPNKLFDYMKSGLAVVASNALPMDRIIKEASCGVTFRNGDIKDLAEKIIDLLLKKDLSDISQNGKKMFKEKYNWDIDNARMIKSIEEIDN